MAATDPGRAEGIARSITDESKKAFVLAKIAQAVAATDPAYAEQLATGAGEIIRAMTSGYAKASVLDALVQAVEAII